MKKTLRPLLAIILVIAMMLPNLTVFAADETVVVSENSGDSQSVSTDGTLGEEEAVSAPNATVSIRQPLTLTAAEHDYMVWPSGDDTIDRPLQMVMNFKANETEEEAAAGPFADYKCDFYLTLTGLANGSITADDCYLAGNYGTFGWIVIPTDGTVLEEGVSYPVVAAYDANLKYAHDICGSVKDFTAAIYVAPAILEANPDFTVTLALKMTNPDDANNVITVGDPAVYTATALGLSTNVPEVADNGLTNAANATAIEAARGELTSAGVTAEAAAAAVATIDITIVSTPDDNGKVVYKVAPTLTAGGKSVKMSAFTEALTFRLPVLATEERTKANVYHEGDLIGTYDIKEENGQKFVEVSSKNFSTFAVEPIEDYAATVADEAGNVVGYDSFANAYAAANDGDTITLYADVKLTGKLTISKAVTIDGNGYSITADETAVWYTVSGMLNLKSYNTHLISINSDNVTLKDITLDCNDNAAGINIYCAQNVVFDNVSIINATKGYAALTVNGSTLTVKNAFTASGNSVAMDISNGTGVTSTLDVTVEEGTVFDLADKTVKFDSAANLDMTKAVAEDGEAYFASIDAAYLYTENQMNSRTTGYNNGLTLLTDVTLNNNLVINGTLDLNGNNLTVAEGYSIKVAKEVTITGEGAIDADVVLTAEDAKLNASANINVTSTAGDVVYRDGAYTVADCVAKIGDIEYTSLAEAVTAAEAGDTITVIADITLTEALTIAADKEVTIDLAGKSVSYTSETAGEDMITNNGTLTVDDSVGGGKITYNNTDTTGANVTVSTITNAPGGLLTVNGGTVENTSVYDSNSTIYPFAIDNVTNGTLGTAKTIINDGTVKSGYRSIRLFANSTSNRNTVNINGGEMIGQVWLQASNSNAQKVTLIISGGSFTPAGNDYSSVFVTTLDATTPTFRVTGGTFATKIGTDNVTLACNYGIAGGTFTAEAMENTPAGLIRSGYEFNQNEDGTYSVATVKVISVTDAEGNVTEYESVDTAVAALTDGATVTLLKDVTKGFTVDGVSVTLDLNGKSLTASGAAIFVENSASLTVKDSAGGGKITATGDVITVTDSTLTVDGGTLETTGSDDCVIAMSYSTVTVNGGELVSADNGINMLENSADAPNVLTVTGGEISGGIGLNILAGNVSVTGGKITGTTNAVSVYYQGAESGYGEIDVAISGGEFDGNITSAAADGLEAESGFISGGTFTTDTTDYCADGYTSTQAEDGTYGVAQDPYAIIDLEDLKAFRDLVNGGDNCNGETWYLAADIDLKNEEWTPIGTNDHSFQGHFDGKDHTVSNLLITGSNSMVGLFGRTNSTGSISNLKLHNAKVSGRTQVGALVGTPSTFTFSNITLTGHVEVSGLAYVGGVGGKNANGNWTDITVDVDSTSFVKADSIENGTSYATYVGGVIGYNGEIAHTITNVTSNIKVIGNIKHIGGLFGMLYVANTVENVTFTGAVEAAEGAQNVGAIAGVWVNNVENTYGTVLTINNAVNNGTVSVGGETIAASTVGGAYYPDKYTAADSGSLMIDGKEAWLKAVKIGDTYYATLADAINAATAGQTVVLLGDVEYDGTIAFFKDITIDLNGNTLTADGVVAFNQMGKIIDSGETKGLLAVPEGYLALQGATGSVLPVWNEEGTGYVFAEVVSKARIPEDSVLADSFKIQFRPEIADGSHFDIFGDGALDNDITMKINISCIKSDGTVFQTIGFDVPDSGSDSISSIYSNDKILSLTISGAGTSFASYKIDIVISTASGMSYTANIGTFTPTAAAE